MSQLEALEELLGVEDVEVQRGQATIAVALGLRHVLAAFRFILLENH